MFACVLLLRYHDVAKDGCLLTINFRILAVAQDNQITQQMLFSWIQQITNEFTTLNDTSVSLSEVRDMSQLEFNTTSLKCLQYIFDAQLQNEIDRQEMGMRVGHIETSLRDFNTSLRDLNTKMDTIVNHITVGQLTPTPMHPASERTSRQLTITTWAPRQIPDDQPAMTSVAEQFCLHGKNSYLTQKTIKSFFRDWFEHSMFNIICTNAEAQTNLNKLAKLMCYLLTFVPTNTDLTKPANIFFVDAWRGKLDELANKTEENAMIFLEANREDTNRINRRIQREQHNDDIISDVPRKKRKRSLQPYVLACLERFRKLSWISYDEPVNVTTEIQKSNKYFGINCLNYVK